ncbi:hypothetical protein ACWKTL_14865 [Bacillus toyonensis]|uniref:hypothetical protein n=1 Tax=Bacillus toyonensis TaxID=155322 RepID=UPI000B44649E|nr:hypothetical protein [Bacillus toyonensis]MED3198993.1 hypothetical protein [Bacillus toyonensis]OTX08254.1 hypothetical protein BK712_10790 [Bacillus thuringiensis serovar seoulensis]
MMMNRVIFEGETYYKVNDLKELYDVSMYKIKKTIKEQGIKTGKLEGFGRTLYILEAELNMLEIDGAVTFMKTAVKDYREEMTVGGRMSALANSMFRITKTNEELIREAHQNAIDELDEHSSTELTVMTENDERDIEAIETFNQLAKEYGYANRFHRIELLINGELTNVVLHTIDGILANIYDFSIITHLSTEYFRSEFERGIFRDGFDEGEFVLTPGESNTTNEGAFIALLQKINDGNWHITYPNGEPELMDDDGMYFMRPKFWKEAEIYVALLKADYKYVNGARQL